MKLTTAQQKDIEICEYFALSGIQYASKNDADIEKFLDYSERGLFKEESDKQGLTYFNKLVDGKIWRGRFMRIYEEGVLDGTMPYYTLLKNPILPREVVDFMKKEMFKGADREIIENIYTEN